MLGSILEMLDRKTIESNRPDCSPMLESRLLSLRHLQRRAGGAERMIAVAVGVECVAAYVPNEQAVHPLNAPSIVVSLLVLAMRKQEGQRRI